MEPYKVPFHKSYPEKRTVCERERGREAQGGKRKLLIDEKLLGREGPRRSERRREKKRWSRWGCWRNIISVRAYHIINRASLDSVSTMAKCLALRSRAPMPWEGAWVEAGDKIRGYGYLDRMKGRREHYISSFQIDLVLSRNFTVLYVAMMELRLIIYRK